MIVFRSSLYWLFVFSSKYLCSISALWEALINSSVPWPDSYLLTSSLVDYTSHNFTVDWHTALWFCWVFIIPCNEDAWRTGENPQPFKMRDSCKSTGDIHGKIENWSHDKIQPGEGRSSGSSALGKMKFLICINEMDRSGAGCASQNPWLWWVLIQCYWLGWEERNLVWSQWWCGTD